MEIYPAIDLRGGYCVRLQQGDYHRETVFDADPLSVARRWANQGANWLHIVDLDGAKEGRPVHQSIIRRMKQEVPVRCQVGGGLRELSHIEELFDLGVDRIVVGTRAIREPEWLHEVTRQFPDRVLLSLDAHGMLVATHGWQQTTEIHVQDVMKQCAELPVAGFVYTDITRDGMLAGPNYEALASLRALTSKPLIASGGVSSLDDIHRLNELRLDGCIIGRALYDGALDVSQALGVIRGSLGHSLT